MWHCGGRTGLATEEFRREAAEVHQQVTQQSAGSLSFEDLCAVCRLLAASGYAPEPALLTAAAARLRELLAGGKAPDSAARGAGAALALAACEAGQQDLGAELVGELCAAGAGGSHGDAALPATGAAALALAATVTGRIDAPLMEALLVRCSARELELSPSALGELRLAVALADPGLLEQLDARASGFFRTLCLPAPLDDPRAALLPADTTGLNAFEEALTPFEAEVSTALVECEIRHSRAAVASGMLLPLSAQIAGGAGALGGEAAKGQLALFAEDVASRAVFSNAPTRRTAFQSWKYRAVARAGWRVFPVEEKAWRGLVGSEQKAAHLRQLLQDGPLHAH